MQEMLVNYNCKAKQSRYTPWWRFGWEEVEFLLILGLSTRWGWVVSVTPRPRFSPWERTLGTHWTGGWVGPRAGLDTEARGNILWRCRWSNPDRPVVHSVVRHYTDWATRLTKFYSRYANWGSWQSHVQTATALLCFLAGENVSDQVLKS
jgi:hypothetical protein